MTTESLVAESGMEQHLGQPRRGFLPVLFLFLLSPLVGEVLAGSTPVDLMGSPANFLVVFLLEVLLYGGGAVLVREVARRAGRGWPSILGLGLAYGLLEEGLVTESFFNPDYLGLHLLGIGSLFGLGWTWITTVLPLHVVWSIGIPIALAELVFRGRGEDPWLGRVGLGVVVALFVLGVVAMWLATYVSERHFVAAWPQLLGVLAVVMIVAGVALRLPRRAAAARGRAPITPHPGLVGAASFAAASLFIGVHQVLAIRPDMPGVIPVAVTLATASGMATLVWRWSGQDGWAAVHRLALAAGGLFTYAWSGFFNYPLSDGIDVTGQVLVDLLAVALAIALAVGLARERPIGDRAVTEAPTPSIF